MLEENVTKGGHITVSFLVYIRLKKKSKTVFINIFKKQNKNRKIKEMPHELGHLRSDVCRGLAGQTYRRCAFPLRMVTHVTIYCSDIYFRLP